MHVRSASALLYGAPGALPIFCVPVRKEKERTKKGRGVPLSIYLSLSPLVPSVRSSSSDRMPPSLLPHQRQVYALAKEGSLPDTVLLWWAMGSGKTLGGLLCTAGLPSSAKVLVLCDKSLLGQWGRAVSSFAAGEHASTKHIDVKHYQTLTTDHLQPGKYDACIVDESHRFRNAFRGDAASSSSRDRGPTELPSWIGAILRCKRLVYLTGTPVVSDAEVETHALHRMLRASPSNPIDGRVFHYARRRTPRSGTTSPPSPPRS